MSEIILSREAAALFLVALGYEAKKWDTNRINARLSKMPQLLATADLTDKTLTDEQKALVEQIKAGGTPKATSTVEKKANPEEKAAKKAAAPAKEKKKTRTQCFCDVVKNLNKTGKTLDEVAEKINAAFIAAGGSDNLKQTVHMIHVFLPVAIGFGVVEYADGKLIPVSE